MIMKELVKELSKLGLCRLDPVDFSLWIEFEEIPPIRLQKWQMILKNAKDEELWLKISLHLYLTNDSEKCGG